MSENTTAMIRVTQLPQIEERLKDFKAAARARADEAISLVCTEENLQFIKSYRAELRRDFDALEEQRKTAKTIVFEPYNHFEAVYKDCVSNAFREADAALKRKIDDVENEIKKRCVDGLREYFDELCTAHHVQWLDFERSGVKVDMASAKQKTPKKLREQLVQFVARVSADLNTIADMENAEEISVVYKDCLDLARAIGVVSDRHRRIEAEREAKEAREAVKIAEAEAVKKVEALAPPIVQEKPMTVTFTVTDTRERLIALREWMKTNNYDYK